MRKLIPRSQTPTNKTFTNTIHKRSILSNDQAHDRLNTMFRLKTHAEINSSQWNTFYDYLSTFVECWVENLHLKCSCTRVSSFMSQPPVPTVEAMDCGGCVAAPGWDECDKHYYEVPLHSAHKHITLYYIPYNKIVVQLYILLLCWRSLWGIFRSDRISSV